jgi:8-oxo-dGTP diphosphatase
MKSMKNLLLLVVAIVLASFLIPLGIVFTFAKALWYRRWRKIVGYLDHSAGALALAIDHFGNTVCRDLFNSLFLKSGGYGFGNIRETISSALGRNAQRGTLSRTGRLLVWILNAIDENHVQKAIRD